LKKIQVIIATSHIDLHEDKILPEALEDAARQIKEKYLPYIVEHDVRYPPIGRVVEAKVIKLKDGEHALQGSVELFEESDNLESLAGDGRRIPIRDQEIQTIAIEYDRSFRDREGRELLRELSQISGEKEVPKEFVKKALEPISTLLIAAGVFAIGSIANGFFSRLGSDAYKRLKEILIKYYRKKISSQQILDFCFLVSHHDEAIEVHILIINPSEQDLNAIFASNFNEVDVLLVSLPLSEADIAKVVFEFKDQRFSLRYSLRSDCVPITFVGAEKGNRNK